MILNKKIITFRNIDYFNPKKDNIIFYHIPKTGGTTLKDFLKKKFRNNCELLGHYHWIRLKKIIIKNNLINEQFFITGHRCYGVESYFKNKSIYITILREPLERALSYYKFDLVRGIIDKSLSFYDYVKNTSSYNVYVKAFGDGDVEKAKIVFKRNIALFGFTDEYENFLKIISYYFKYHTIEVEKKLINNKLISINLKQQEKDRVMELMKDDYNFYFFAKNLYEKRYSDIIHSHECSIKMLITNTSFVKKEEDILKSKNKKEKFHILAIKNEKLKKFELAEKYHKIFAKLVNDDHLIAFYFNNNLYKNYINYIKRQSLYLYKYMTKKVKSDMNDYLSHHITNLIYYEFKSGKDYQFLEFLLKKYYIILKRSLSISAISYFISENLELLLNKNYLKEILWKYFYFKTKISKNTQLSIFGCKKAANIAYNVCIFFDIKVLQFVDEHYFNSTYKNIPIISLDEFLKNKLEDKILLLGPCQKNNFNENVLKNCKIIKL